MADLSGLELTDSKLDDVILFGRHGDKRHAILARQYGDVCSHLARVIRRIDQRWVEHAIASQRTRLMESGTAVSVSVNGRHIGLMRPKLLGDRQAIDDAQQPALIAYQATEYELKLPILAASVEDADRLVGSLADAGVGNKDNWTHYVCERREGLSGRLAFKLTEFGVALYQSDLERLFLMPEHQIVVPRSVADAA